jgi:colanic acid/amylovoran biosynthesis protein
MTDVDPGRGPVVVQGTTACNGGDAALLLAQLRTIEDALGPGPIVVFDQQAELVARHVELPANVEVRPMLTGRPPSGGRWRWAFRLLRLRVAAACVARGRDSAARRAAPDTATLDALHLYRDADAVFTPGGTMLVDQYTLLPRLVDAAIACRLGASFVMFTQTLGPFSRRIDRTLLRRVLRQAVLVLVRGEASRRTATRLGAPASRVAVVADPVFLFATTRSTTAPAATGVAPDTLADVAVSVRDWPHFTTDPAQAQARYEASVAELTRHLVEQRGAHVTFRSTCQGVPGYAFDDAAVATRIVASLAPGVAEHCVVDREHHRPEELLALYGRADLVVATRLHAAILALDAGVPVLPIEYEPKTSEVFARLGHQWPVVDIGTLTASSLITALDALLAATADERDALRQAVAAERASAESVAGLVRAAVPPGHGRDARA